MIGRLVSAWRSKSLGTKIGGAVVVPLLVGLILIAVERIATDGRGAVKSPPSNTGETSENLEIVDVAFTEVIVNETLSDGDGTSEERDQPAFALDIAVRNIGDAVSFVDRVELRVLERLNLEACSAEGGEVEISGAYSVTFSEADGIGAIVRHAVRQAVAANSVDRFQVTLGTPPRYAPEPGTIMQLEVFLLHDSSDVPIAGGRVIAAPAPIAERSIDPTLADFPDCTERNLAALERARIWEGVRSPDMERILG